MLTTLKLFLQSELGRIAFTALIITIGFFLFKWISYYITAHNKDRAMADKRSMLVISKNLVVITCLIFIFGVWSSKLAGFALSLAAITGAILIVSKELITSVYGYIVVTVSRPYGIGDFIETGSARGKVIDLNIFYTKLAEADSSNQLTGKTISFPNSSILTTALCNITATGDYVVDLLKITVPLSVDIEIASECAMDAALLATSSWAASADEHLNQLESSMQIDLPSAKPKILWESKDAKAHVLIIRFTTPVNERVNCEQQIYREFWKTLKQKTVVKVSSGPEAE